MQNLVNIIQKSRRKKKRIDMKKYVLRIWLQQLQTTNNTYFMHSHNLFFGGWLFEN